MNRCKKCNGPAPDGHELCWFCEHEGKLTKQESECTDSCSIGSDNDEHFHQID